MRYPQVKQPTVCGRCANRTRKMCSKAPNIVVGMKFNGGNKYSTRTSSTKATSHHGSCGDDVRDARSPSHVKPTLNSLFRVEHRSLRPTLPSTPTSINASKRFPQDGRVVFFHVQLARTARHDDLSMREKQTNGHAAHALIRKASTPCSIVHELYTRRTRIPQRFVE